MRNYQTGVGIARHLQKTERAVDDAIVEAADLLKAMINGRRSENMAAEVGHAALVRVASGLNAMALARGEFVEGHGVLAAVADQQQIGWRMDGSLEEKLKPATASAAA